MTSTIRFTGPKITLSLDDLSESQERAIAEEDLDVEIVNGVEAGSENSHTSHAVDPEKADT